MRRFAELYQALDASTATTTKVAALVQYLGTAPPADAAWAVYFLAGGRPRQVMPTALLRELACQQAGIDDWLFEACYQAVGDLAETIAHVLPPAVPGQPGGEWPDDGLAVWVEQRLLPLRGLPPAEQAQRAGQALAALDAAGRFLYIKLIGGGFRVGVSKLLVQRALAQVAGVDAKCMAQRLVGWTDARATPSASRWQALVVPWDGNPGAAVDPSALGLPYPFFLAHALAGEPEALGPCHGWLVEWKYDGIRAQVVKRAGQVWVWSRGEELVTAQFPEVASAAAALPDGTVLDGELLVWLPGAERPAPFQKLQQRLNRKLLGKKLLAEAPVRFVAYDLLEQAGCDLRNQPQQQRRDALQAVHGALASGAAGAVLGLSPLVQGDTWAAFAAWRQTAGQRGMEGLMLKQVSACYGTGRSKAEGVWCKWKLQPLSVDAVLIYAQAGHGRRAGLYTDYTFAVWSRAPVSTEEAQAVVEAIGQREPAQPGALQLLPFAKAYSGLSDDEFAAVDRVVRATTLEKFGPVRSVRPTLVFEIGFEGISESARHKSGVAVRFPRMLRLRPDKPLHEADTLPSLLALITP